MLLWPRLILVILSTSTSDEQEIVGIVTYSGDA